jgi:uncharacterized membrane protein YadS
MRCIRSHCHSRSLQSQKGGADPCHRPLYLVYRYYDGGDAGVDQTDLSRPHGGSAGRCLGAVAAAGAFLGERALYVAATIKMIQNILIGVIAFLVALYWTTKVENNSGNNKRKINLVEIWYRFPKFVLGFIFASVLLSLFYAAFGNDLGYALVDKGLIKGMTDIGRGWFFALAFICIGLETNFKDLAHYFKGGKPLILYLSGQTLNLILTLAMAYLMFYIMFPSITAGI